jgi:hypothetical protein
MAMSRFVEASIGDGGTCNNVSMQCQIINLCGIKCSFDEAVGWMWNFMHGASGSKFGNNNKKPWWKYEPLNVNLKIEKQGDGVNLWHVLHALKSYNFYSNLWTLP